MEEPRNANRQRSNYGTYANIDHYVCLPMAWFKIQDQQQRYSYG